MYRTLILGPASRWRRRADDRFACAILSVAFMPRRGTRALEKIGMNNSVQSRIQLTINPLLGSIGSSGSLANVMLALVTRLVVCSALISIASCNGSPPYDYPIYCQGKPCLNASLEKGKIGYRVLLVGDAGAPVEMGKKSLDQFPVLKALEYFAGFIPERTVVVFLGDSVYPAGLPDETGQSPRTDEDCLGRACAEKRIDVQIDILKASGAKGIIVPGNHDWNEGGRKGVKRILNLGEYIADSRERKKINVDFIPKNGCPGPITVPLSGKKVAISLIVLDTQWWLHDYRKPGKDDNSSQCKQVTETGVIESIKKQIMEETRKQRHIMLVAHHPLKSYGEHGAFYSMKDLVRPLYLFEQNIRKSIFAGRQNLHNAIYKNMRAKIQDAIRSGYGKVKIPLIYAAGHDHSLQIIKDSEEMFHLVSGAGSGWNATRVGQGEGTLFSHANRKTGGFMAVDYLQSGEIRLAVIEPISNGEECKLNGGKACVVFSAWAKRFPN